MHLLVRGFERLQQAVAPNAFHNAGHILDPPKCHPNTRTAVITKIMDWISGVWDEHSEAVILWFYGPAGSGKSAIGRRIAELCDWEKRLLASFFFSRGDPTRINATSLIATIAYQIAINLPHTREKMVAAIERDPLILTRSLEAQSVALVVEPLRELIDAGYFNTTSSPRLIIIDGLDECDTPDMQCKILDMISLLFQKYHLPFLILVASRPERHLTHSFNTWPLQEFHTTLALDDTYRPDDDIRLLLTDNFRRIHDTHPMKTLLHPLWPSIDVLDKLVNKSSGQFIYASTVIKYVTSLRHQPADRLNVILGIRPPRHDHEMPFGELDALYRYILSTVEDRETVLLILGFFLIKDISHFGSDNLLPQDLERFFLLNRGDINILFGDLSSIITISNNRPYFHIPHASLRDFLLDATRSKEFYIDLSSIHTTCMHLCFQHIKKCMFTYLPSKEVAIYLLVIGSISNDCSKHTTYAVSNLVFHCKNTPLSTSLQLCEEIVNFSLHTPNSCFPHHVSGMSLFYHVPKYLQFIKTLVCPTYFYSLTWHIECMEQPFDGIDEIYKQNLGVVLKFFVSKLPLYYSSSRMTLLLTVLDIPPDLLPSSHSLYTHFIVPLPSRLKTMDDNALGLHNVFSYFSLQNWNIFRDFLDSGHPQALDRKRHATAALACLKIIFKHYQVPLSRFSWLGQHSRTPGVAMKQHSQRHRTDIPWPAETDWKQNAQFYWHLRVYLPTWTPQKMPKTPEGNSDPDEPYWEFQEKIHNDSLRSGHLQFLLEKSAHSNAILDFARLRVFRFGYLHRKHPTYMKKAIFALAKYIQRVTGETAEVKACEAIWGRDEWFTMN